MNETEYKGFLLIQKTYRVMCRQCGFRGKAVLGEEPIQGADAGAEEYCPVCNHQALVADNRKE